MQSAGVRLAMWALFSCFLVPVSLRPADAADTNLSEKRIEQLVEGNIIAVHAYQIELSRKQGNVDTSCWPQGSPPDSELQKLVEHQTSLLAVPEAEIKAWLQGEPSSFDPSRDLEPLVNAGLALNPQLPVNVFASYLHSKSPSQPKSQIRSVANLYQTVLEVERDGDRLQDLFKFYIALGLPVYVGQFGLPGTNEDFLETGRELERASCSSPVGVSAGEWQIAGRKIWNWGEKNLHVRDANVLANELLKEPDVQSLLPTMKSFPAERVAIIGHSYTMDLHWASPSAFVPIVTAMFAQQNPGVEFRQFQAGGLTSSRAFKNFYADALAWKPAVVLFVVANRTDEDRNDLKNMAQGFEAAGARVLMFDDLLDPDDLNPERLKANLAAAREAGIHIIPVEEILHNSPDRSKFLCLDYIHMTEPYHRLMAKQWLKALLETAKNSPANQDMAVQP